MICAVCWQKNCKKHEGQSVQIDVSIADIIIQLNLKGYKTKYCCGGHISSIDNYFVNPIIYIMFNDDILIPRIPNGFQYIKYHNQIQSICELDNMIEQHEWLKKTREELRKWANII